MSTGELTQDCHTRIWVGLTGGSPESLTRGNGSLFQCQNALVLLGLKSVSGFLTTKVYEHHANPIFILSKSCATNQAAWLQRLWC